MRTPPFTDNLDPMQRVCICGCHCGSLIPVSRHAAKQAGPRSSGKAVLTGRILFNPHQVLHWRNQVLAAPELRTSFEGHHLETIEIDLQRQRDDLGPASLIGSFYPPANTFGKPFDPSCLRGVTPTEIRAPVPMVRAFPHARIVGFSALLTEDNDLQFSNFPSSTDPKVFLDRSIHQGFMAEEVGGRMLIHFVARPRPQKLRSHALFLPEIEAGNFGSFMFRQLPQMIHLRDAEIQFDCYIVSERTPWSTEAFELVKMPRRPVLTVREVCGEIFSSVTMCIMDDLEGFLRPETRAGVRTIVREVDHRVGVHKASRLYVSRALSSLARPQYRPMLNETEVEDVLKARQFQIVHPETMTLVDQIRSFAAATHVVGPSGSGMFNIMFNVRPSRVLDLETISFGVRQHAKLYSSCGKQYSFAFVDVDREDRRPPHTRPWRLPRECFEEALDWLLS